ncbi:hypothetical protein SNE40_008629 [Patella caerulea]|uniref:AIG1-type G domain-containing protein n=1 Tax=Patella caerulea TaxID=87958 RepID=A0AAN8JQA8_PATCE
MATSGIEEIRVVLVGKTGRGKSALGNSLLRSKHSFKSAASGESITSRCTINHLDMQNGKKLVVVDTPGLFDTRVSNAKTSRELVRCVALASPGPHAFLFVLSVDRFTKEELDTIDHLQELFGNDVMNFVIVVFNHKDTLEYEEKTLEEHIQSSPQGLQNLIRRCGGRMTTINNRVQPGSNEPDVNAIISLVEQVKHSNGGNYYTEAMFEAAEEVFQTKLENLKAELAKQGKRLTEYEMRDTILKEVEENDGILVTFAKGIEKTFVKTGKAFKGAWRTIISVFK